MSKFKNSRPQSDRITTGLCLLVMMFLGLLLPRCAQIVAPTGGPKDTLPPVLLSANPADSTLNFDSKTILFEFNEFIQLKDLQNQMIISPNPKRSPEISTKLRTLSFSWPDKDSLKPNTTYIINMGNAIEDINESNPLKGFRYVFSTGDYLDSLEIHGKVIDARTGLPDSTALVMLYDGLKDSVVTKDKPTYYARCEGDGSFQFQNLPHDTFKVFALVEENGSLKYDDTSEHIAFLKHPIKLDSIQTGIVLSLFKENTKEYAPLTFVTSTRSRRQDIKKPLKLTFNKALETIDSNGIRLQEDSTHHPVKFQLIEEKSKKTIQLDYPWKEDASYRILLDSAFAIDTFGIAYAQSDTLTFTAKSATRRKSTKEKKEEKPQLTFSTSLKGQLQDLKTPLELSFNRILQSIDSSGIRLQEDTTHRNVAFQWEKDTSGKAILLHYQWKEDMPYRLLLDSAFAIDTSGLAYAKKDTLDFQSKSKSDYGKLILHFIDVPGEKQEDTAALASDSSSSYQLVVELYRDKKMIYSAPLEGNTWSKDYLDPGDYKVHVIKDMNKNGKWDTGCYFCEVQRQPEPVYSLPDAFTVRANWENDNPDLQIKFEESSVQ